MDSCGLSSLLCVRVCYIIEHRLTLTQKQKSKHGYSRNLSCWLPLDDACALFCNRWRNSYVFSRTRWNAMPAIFCSFILGQLQKFSSISKTCDHVCFYFFFLVVLVDFSAHVDIWRSFSELYRYTKRGKIRARAGFEFKMLLLFFNLVKSLTSALRRDRGKNGLVN